MKIQYVIAIHLMRWLTDFYDFMFKEHLQQKLEYTLLKPYCLRWGISNVQSGREDTLEDRYAIKFCFKLGKNAEIIKIGQSSHKMYSNNLLNFQESTTILNVCTKKSGNLLNSLHMHEWDLALNKLRGLICHKTKTKKTKPIKVSQFKASKPTRVSSSFIGCPFHMALCHI